MIAKESFIDQIWKMRKEAHPNSMDEVEFMNLGENVQSGVVRDHASVEVGSKRTEIAGRRTGGSGSLPDQLNL